jgi:predicted O-methyltransferase YrrM
VHNYSANGEGGLPEGWFYPEEIAAYRAMAETVKNGLVVEIGVWCGRSLACIAPICRANRCRLVAIDPDPRFLRYQPHYDGLDSVEFIVGKSADLAWQFSPQTIDLLFIDGDHTYEGVKIDLELWVPLVKPGGIVAGHDYSWDDNPAGGVTRAVKEYFGHGAQLGGGSVWKIPLARPYPQRTVPTPGRFLRVSVIR